MFFSVRKVIMYRLKLNACCLMLLTMSMYAAEQSINTFLCNASMMPSENEVNVDARLNENKYAHELAAIMSKELAATRTRYGAIYNGLMQHAKVEDDACDDSAAHVLAGFACGDICKEQGDVERNRHNALFGDNWHTTKERILSMVEKNPEDAEEEAQGILDRARLYQQDTNACRAAFLLGQVKQAIGKVQDAKELYRFVVRNAKKPITRIPLRSRSSVAAHQSHANAEGFNTFRKRWRAAMHLHDYNASLQIAQEVLMYAWSARSKERK